jgi:type VI secretion system protein ImpB
MANDNLPRSRLTLTYRMDVKGKPKDVELPFRMVILGNLSGTPDEKRKDLDKRPIRRLNGKNLNQVMADMALSTTVTVPNRIGHNGASTLEVALQFKDMQSFSPEAVSDQIKPVKALKLLKALLLEAQANLDNSKEFRGLVRALPEQADQLKKSLKEFEHYDLATLGKKPAKPAQGATNG